MRIHWKSDHTEKTNHQELLDIEYDLRRKLALCLVPHFENDEEHYTFEDIELCFDQQTKRFSICDPSAPVSKLLLKYIQRDELKGFFETACHCALPIEHLQQHPTNEFSARKPRLFSRFKRKRA